MKIIKNHCFKLFNFIGEGNQVALLQKEYQQLRTTFEFGSYKSFSYRGNPVTSVFHFSPAVPIFYLPNFPFTPPEGVKIRVTKIRIPEMEAEID